MVKESLRGKKKGNNCIVLCRVTVWGHQLNRSFNHLIFILLGPKLFQYIWYLNCNCIHIKIDIIEGKKKNLNITDDSIIKNSSLGKVERTHLFYVHVKLSPSLFYGSPFLQGKE